MQVETETLDHGPSPQGPLVPSQVVGSSSSNHLIRTGTVSCGFWTISPMRVYSTRTGHSQMRVGNSAARNLTEHLSHHDEPTVLVEQHMRTSISLLPRQARTAEQLHGVLGQAPPSFQVLLRVCPESARPAQVGTGSIVARASGTRRRNLRRRCRICKGAETLALRRRSIDTRPARYPLIHPPKHHQKTRPNPVVR